MYPNLRKEIVVFAWLTTGEKKRYQSNHSSRFYAAKRSQFYAVSRACISNQHLARRRPRPLISTPINSNSQPPRQGIPGQPQSPYHPLYIFLSYIYINTYIYTYKQYVCIYIYLYMYIWIYYMSFFVESTSMNVLVKLGTTYNRYKFCSGKVSLLPLLYTWMRYFNFLH